MPGSIVTRRSLGSRDATTPPTKARHQETKVSAGTAQRPCLPRGRVLQTAKGKGEDAAMTTPTANAMFGQRHREPRTLRCRTRPAPESMAEKRTRLLGEIDGALGEIDELLGAGGGSPTGEHISRRGG